MQGKLFSWQMSSAKFVKFIQFGPYQMREEVAILSWQTALDPDPDAVLSASGQEYIPSNSKACIKSLQ